MVLVQALLAFIGRSAGKLLNMVFGWATVMLFGRVPQSRQLHMSIIAFGSVAWIIVALGVAFPRFGAFLLSFITLPDWVNDNWIRLAMLAAVVVIPLVVGVVSIFMLPKERRPKGMGERVKAVVKGYPYTLGLAVTLLMMIVFVPFMKLRTVLKRWKSQHMAVLVESQDYMDTVGSIEKALEERGWKAQRAKASWMMRLPTKVLTTLAGGAIEDMVADEMTVLKAKALEVLLHPSDIVVSGKEADVIHARAAIAERLTFTRAHLTWTKEANDLEDRFRTVWEQRAEGVAALSALGRIQPLEKELHTVEVPFEEWEVLFREKLLLERELLRHAAGLSGVEEDGEHKGLPILPIAAVGTLTTSAVLAWLRRRSGHEDQKRAA